MALPGGTIGNTFSSRSIRNSMTVGTFPVFFAANNACLISSFVPPVINFASAHLHFGYF